MSLQGEVVGVKEMHLGVGIVALTGLGARRQDEKNLAAPGREQGRCRLRK
jgi:hypothetical protein